jgi:hypothetical protein
MSTFSPPNLKAEAVAFFRHISIMREAPFFMCLKKSYRAARADALPVSYTDVSSFY